MKTFSKLKLSLAAIALTGVALAATVLPSATPAEAARMSCREYRRMLRIYGQEVDGQLAIGDYDQATFYAAVWLSFYDAGVADGCIFTF